MKSWIQQYKHKGDSAVKMGSLAFVTKCRHVLENNMLNSLANAQSGISKNTFYDDFYFATFKWNDDLGLAIDHVLYHLLSLGSITPLPSRTWSVSWHLACQPIVLLIGSN